MRSLYSESDHGRVVGTQNSEDYRDEWRRDYARLIHSVGFRRLQGKTQVFPGHEGDFFRNRLTHSLEVAQIAKSIAIRLNATHELFADPAQKLVPDLVEFAGMAHDLGHPPFGHNGEEALDECMRESFGGFEGNAQTFRILSRLEKKVTLTAPDDLRPFADEKDQRCGLNLTYRSLASILKYDSVIPIRSGDRPEDKRNEVVKGFYESDRQLVEKIKEKVLGEKYVGKFKVVECSIMDIADDIAYSTYDLEDVFKSGFLSPLDLFALDFAIYDNVVTTINKRLAKQYPEVSTRITVKDVHEILHDVFSELFTFGTEQIAILKNRKSTNEYKKMYFSVEAQQRSRLYAEDGYYRTAFTSNLVGAFIQGVEVQPNSVHPQLHNVRLDLKTFITVEVLKNITYEAVIRAPALQVVEYRGKDIIKKIYDAINEKGGDRLLPRDFREIYKNGDDLNKCRTVCDFIAGMTDRYAVEFYSRLFGANGMTMHKPL
ncbi:dNTP triphosphohydrolase [Mesorhizobium sp. B2-4-15]|uniref:dGTP triphosphohydrolase n=1 Tax=Mesorhizobium sp. B2-4-15 TaxID=2589934 RepID=UPI001153D49A|nr:dNTP triphosphohydrolase [Mesorhizobium sp. B2-4-15]TPK69881.1 dNTP triphosphohydrolase [Mesorhizobium sp. B2-4-15]